MAFICDLTLQTQEVKLTASTWSEILKVITYATLVGHKWSNQKCLHQLYWLWLFCSVGCPSSSSYDETPQLCIIIFPLYIENDQVQRCKELVTIDTHQCIEVLLAPCPATDLLDLLMERKSLSIVRGELQGVIRGVTELQADLSAPSILPLAKKVMNKLIFTPYVDRVRNRIYMMHLVCIVGKLLEDGNEKSIGMFCIQYEWNLSLSLSSYLFTYFNVYHILYYCDGV